MSIDIFTPMKSFALQFDPDFRSGIDLQDFRDAMASLAATACVVATLRGDERLGRTVTAALSLTIEPPTVLVSIAAGSPLAEAIGQTRAFSVQLLSDRQQSVADAFAGRLDPAERFRSGGWESFVSGQPRLTGAVAALDCRVIGVIETGGHLLFAGGVAEIDLNAARNPLIWHRRSYGFVRGGTAV